MVGKAKKLSERAHKNQIRKFDGSPYIVHPKSVVKIVINNKKSKNIKELISAAYLHDVIEDSGISFNFLLKEFGYMVASIILEVTNDKPLVKKYGKKHYMSNKVLTLTNYGLVIKLSDRLDNVSDLYLADIDFKDRYVDETKFVIQVLEDFRDLTGTQIKLVKQIKDKIDDC
jgi:(p)ppGpp synthase/HD superfamily hydrolase